MNQFNDTTVNGDLTINKNDEEINVGNDCLQYNNIVSDLDDMSAITEENAGKYVADARAVAELNGKITKHITKTATVSGWGNVGLGIDSTKNIIKCIYNSNNKYLVLPYISNGEWSANIRLNSFGSTDLICPVGETVTLEVYYEEL